MKKNVYIMMLLLSTGLAACGTANKTVTEELETESTEVVAEATEGTEVEETETAEEVVINEENAAVSETKNETASTPNTGNNGGTVTPAPMPDASANGQGTTPDPDTSKPTMKDLEQLEPGSQIGDTGFTWGEGVGGLGTQTPTTDGYGEGATITIEPVN